MNRFPRCQILPLPDQQVAFVVDGQERTRWHFSPQYPRPFLYPLRGPSGASLTRMGHPGAANHDHHRSVWFAHQKMLGIDFWSDNTAARIRQLAWQVYRDGDDEAVMAVELGWFDGHDPQELLRQQLIIAVRSGDRSAETLIELQSGFQPVAEQLEFGQTNFGFLAVRVAKHISAHFGGGRLTGSEGAVGEAGNFGKAARWMDYSGPAPPGSKPSDEGITYFDHPSNPQHPVQWHVRDDGWMGASVCMSRPHVTRRDQPLMVRYLLHVHAGPVDAARADATFEQFARAPAWIAEKSGRPHEMFEVRRSSV
jgi:hypothetical protein